MNNASLLLRTLVTYAVIVPLAILIGFLLTNPLDYSTFALFTVLALTLVFPLLMRWHYPLMLLCWGAPITVFFLKGAPSLCLVMAAISLGISLLERAMNNQTGFIRVPQITWPLICMMAVVVFTAKMTGGFGLKSFGSDVYGGKKYIFLLMGILSYFAVTARRIPPERAKLYVSLFLLGGVLNAVGDFYLLAPSWASIIFMFIPPVLYGNEFELGATRLVGIASAASTLCLWMMARYGIRGIFLSGRPWRPVMFALFFVMVFLGGFRSAILEIGSIFIMLFFLEGLQRTKLLPVFIWVGILSALLVIPLASKLPFTFQRALAFLPLNISHQAKQDAAASLDWRVEMWKALLPQIPRHLLVGKGFAISIEDYNDTMAAGSAFRTTDPSQQGLALAGDYHNGPLSVVLPFGIWGVITFFWFLFAGLRVMYANFRHGDPPLQTINTFLWVYFFYYSFRFVFLGGGFASDMATFTGVLGLSIAINGGMRQAAPQTVPAKQRFNRASLEEIRQHRRSTFQR